MLHLYDVTRDNAHTNDNDNAYDNENDGYHRNEDTYATWTSFLSLGITGIHIRVFDYC